MTKEQKAEYARRYKEKYPERVAAYQQAYSVNNRDAINKRMGRWRDKNREYIRKRDSESREKKRKNLLWILGGKCAMCSFSDWRALQIDHIDGDGCEERRFFKRVPNTALYLKLIKKNKGKYQVLCANCNWIKRYENKEFGGAKRLKVVHI